jgi:hypothetical protein
MDGRRRGGSRLFAMDGASAGQRRALKPSVTTSACLRETARLGRGGCPLGPSRPLSSSPSTGPAAEALRMSSGSGR